MISFSLLLICTLVLSLTITQKLCNKRCSLTARFELILKIPKLQENNGFVSFILKKFELILKIPKLKLTCNCFVPFI